MPQFIMSCPAYAVLPVEARDADAALAKWRQWRADHRRGLVKLKGGGRIFIPPNDPSILDPDGRPIGAVAGVAGR